MPRFDLRNYPKEPGVYLMKGTHGEVLYVGKAKNLKNRLKQYFGKSGDSRPMIPHLLAQIKTIETLVVTHEKEALLLESTLIKRHQPKYNAFLKDDKSYINLMINTSHVWPRIQLIRYKKKPKEQDLAFGPYTSAFAARHLFDLMMQIFPLRQCSDEELKRRKRPCLLYGMKRCIAPCAGKCTREEYDSFVRGAIDFLRGKDDKIAKELKSKMQSASDNLEFEKAGAFLQTLKQLEQITEGRQVVFRPSERNCDALSFYRTYDEAILMQLIFREGKLVGSEHYSFYDVIAKDSELLSTLLLQIYETAPPPPEILIPFPLPQSSSLEEILSQRHRTKLKIRAPKRGEGKSLVALATKNAKATFEKERSKQELKETLLFDLMDTLKLGRYPKRIECFDTSHFFGSDLVAAMICFTDGKKESRRTRTFKICDVHKGDDYAALHQVLTRRLLRAKQEEDLPDLILIDGGKGQLHVAEAVLKELDIITSDVISLSKEKGRHDKGLREEKIFILGQSGPILLSSRSPLLFFIQQIRDAAHEKALSFHRLRRKKRVVATALETLPGIGPKKSMRLLSRFGSIKRIQEASLNDLLQVKGITKKDAERLLNYE